MKQFYLDIHNRKEKIITAYISCHLYVNQHTRLEFQTVLDFEDILPFKNQANRPLVC